VFSADRASGVRFLQRVTCHAVAWEEVSLIFKEKKFSDVNYSSPLEPASKRYALNRLLQRAKGRTIDLDFRRHIRPRCYASFFPYHVPEDIGDFPHSFIILNIVDTELISSHFRNRGRAQSLA
jgi:hypothetical protein